MKDILKDILFAPSRFSVRELNRRLENGEYSHDELAGVLGDTVAGVVLNPPALSHYPSGVNRVKVSDANKVVFWGMQGTGKTSVIASLLALPGMITDGLNSEEIRDRIHMLKSTFANTEPQVMPSDRSTGSRAYNATYTQGSRTYLLSLIEANDWNQAKELIDGGWLQLVHVFCLDCRTDLDVQIAAFRTTIDRLEKEGLIGSSAGLYILVSKSDLMCAPRAYLDNAAQAMVTASVQSFWQYVRKTCKENFIYNEQPIVCSVGNFVLKDYATLTTEYTSRLLQQFLLPKCEHRHWGLVGLLRKMGKVPAMICVAVLAIAAAAGIYWLLDAIAQPPTRVLQPFDYKTYFSGEVARTLPSDSVYGEGISRQYWDLRKDLTVESELRQTDKEPVLDSDDFAYCDTRLSNAFAVIVNKKLDMVFRACDWTEYAMLKQVFIDLKDLGAHKRNMTDDNAGQCEKYRGYIEAYYNSVIPLINKSNDCQTLADLNYVKEQVEQWNDYPFTNDTTLCKNLDDAVYNAYLSLSSHLLDSARAIRQDYDNLSIWRRVSNSSYERQLENRAERLDDAAEDLQEQLNEDADEDHDYWQVQENLDSVRNLLNSIVD